VVPFTALSFTGLLVSTVTVGLVSARTTSWSHWGHTVAVELANVAAYGSLWVVQYVVLDRFLFRNREGTPPS
jgi:putative flippase GtrA